MIKLEGIMAVGKTTAFLRHSFVILLGARISTPSLSKRSRNVRANWTAPGVSP